MRTGRARLIEWIQDIIATEMYGGGYYTVEEWADRIMGDINRGIISKEES